MRRVPSVHGEVHAGDIACGIAEEKNYWSAEVVVVRHAAEERGLAVTLDETVVLSAEKSAGR